MKSIETMEEDLAVLVGIRERSVGLTLKRTNYRIAALQSQIRAAEMGQ